MIATTAARLLAPTSNLTERVAASMRDDIMQGRFKLGQLLPSEGAMATSFGVSRTVMREAISRLKAEGLVSTRQGLGVFVAAARPPQVFRIDPSTYGDVEEVLRIVELRMGFEAEAAALAAVRRTTADLKNLRQAIEAMAAAIDLSDLEGGVAADVEFHGAICEATHSRYYPALFSSLGEFLRENIALSRDNSSRHHRAAQSQSEHRAIFKAIQARDPEEARSAVRSHLENTALRLNEYAELTSGSTKKPQAGGKRQKRTDP
ncbi:MAG: FadR family transcriptional regulator [Proteobacteria bacterium]|nr:FadR family transcriptional regulator [Pseudomonadota bacterium]